MLVEHIELAATFAHRLPRVAFALLSGDWKPTSYTMRADIPNANSDQLITTELPEEISCDLLVCDWVYSVLRRSYNVGSLFRGQEEVNNTLIPGLALQLVLKDCPDTIVSDNATPIEHILRPSPLPLRMCRPFFLSRNASVAAQITVLRDIDPAELPMSVYMTVVGYRLVCGLWQTARPEQVEIYLKAWLGDRYIKQADRG